MTQRVLGTRSRQRVLVLDSLAGDEVDAPAERAEHVLVAPHDALRKPVVPPV